MKKEEQKVINSICEMMQEKAYNELQQVNSENTYVYPWYCLKSKSWKRLRSMSAHVLETEHYYFLCSYQTIVAFIDKQTDECYDVLRLVYGYTATSAKHISAFDHDYGSEECGCTERLTWRYV